MENPLLELQEYDNLIQALNKGKGPLQVTGTLDSQKVHLMYGLSGLFPYHLILADDERNAKETPGPRKYTMISGTLQTRYGSIRPKTCCFTVRTSMETL